MVSYYNSMATIICNNYNKSLLDKTIPEDLKTAEFMPVYKKKKCTNKNNYRLEVVKILSNISKNCEISFYNQIYDYFDRIFSNYQCRFSAVILTDLHWTVLIISFLLLSKMLTVLIVILYQ